MTEPANIAVTPDLKAAWNRVRATKYPSIRAYAEALIQLVHYRDEDGRGIGYDYSYIRDKILKKFPVVNSSGPHKGKPTKIAYHELWMLSWELKCSGVRLPFRLRRPR